ncbi:uncharacterized protein SETTUDRAFT_20029 [Exserohilum turcica Et28A]|uniref:Uncharacterized protein n=1 Tax=Exserohilum turcicum (strain 28A) TaxID=671987 RepID=R0K4M4_EXST2|nr:uncharacterized protein SETTUDRAFT_20029 [Exserohilum turcica Et28A]EOA84489.1 hypothetical protein SETTUDRAFT_20029 [Exserohilum turcica Et28A]
MEANAPNLNVEELAAYATTKSQAGVPDEEILREITQMLREDGWKEAAIGPTIEAVVKRSLVVGGKGSPRQEGSLKANQNAVAQVMEQMMQLLSPMASRLEALERNQAEGRSESSPRVNTPLPPLTTVAELAAQIRVRREARIFAASIADIDKALQPKKPVDEFYELFNPKQAEKLPPHQGPGVDHKIKLELKDA